MNSKTTIPPIYISLFALVAVFILVLAMRATSEILAPILLALVLAITTTPLLHWLMKKGAPGWSALTTTIIINLLIILGLVWLVGRSVQDFSENVSVYEQRFQEIQQSVGEYLDEFGVDVDNLAADPILSPASLLDVAAGFAGGVVSGLSNWGLVIMTSIFFLVEAISMPRKVENIAEESNPDVQRIISLNQGLRQYMAINAGVGALAAVFNFIMLSIVGIEFAVLWAVLSFFFSFIPNIGFIISVIPPAIMALIQFGVTEMLIVIAAYIIINFAVDNVIKPRFIEEGVNISASITFLSLVIWGWVLGPIGAILAVPMAIIVQAILNSREETRWLAYIMGSGKEPFEPETESDQ